LVTKILQVVDLYGYVVKGIAPKILKFRTKSIEKAGAGDLHRQIKIGCDTVPVTHLFKKSADTKALDDFKL